MNFENNNYNNGLRTSKKENKCDSEQKLEVFVGGLPSHTTSSMLKSYFSNFGNIRKARPQKWKSGAKKCRGFAIIECSDSQTFNSILNSTHNFEGRIIECKKCMKKSQLSNYNSLQQQKRIFVANLPRSLTSLELESLFHKLSDVEFAYIIKDPKTDQGRGIGYITFTTIEGKEKVLAQGSIQYQGRTIYCKKYKKDAYEEKKKFKSQMRQSEFNENQDSNSNTSKNAQSSKYSNQDGYEYNSKTHDSYQNTECSPKNNEPYQTSKHPSLQESELFSIKTLMDQCFRQDPANQRKASMQFSSNNKKFRRDTISTMEEFNHFSPQPEERQMNRPRPGGSRNSRETEQWWSKESRNNWVNSESAQKKRHSGD